jgi:hypothetical protein
LWLVYIMYSSKGDVRKPIVRWTQLATGLDVELRETVARGRASRLELNVTF